MQKSFYFFCYVLIYFFSSCSEDPLNSSQQIQINQVQLNSAFDSARNLGRVKCLLVSCQDTFYKAEFFLPGAETQTHDVMSVTKSVTSLLIGIAIDKGIIPSVDEPIDGYIRPLVNDLDSAKGQITIKQLLTMSCGLEWSEIPGPSEFMQWYTSPDKLLYIINKPFVSVPVSFNYSDGAAHLASVVLTQATNMTANEFAQQYLFTPLGIDERNWTMDNRGFNYNSGESFNYSDGAAHLASVVLSQASNMTANEFAQQYLFTPLGIDERNWTLDNRGFNYGGVRLFLFPDDMLRIGKLSIK